MTGQKQNVMNEKLLIFGEKKKTVVIFRQSFWVSFVLPAG
jgi:hypothetical protein